MIILFHSYCDHLITEELCKLTEQLLKDLFRFQSRAYEKNQIKATAHRRYVVGFKETNRQLQIRKVKLLLISPDLEPNEGQGRNNSFLIKTVFKSQKDI